MHKQEELFKAASNVVNNYFMGTNTTGRNYSDDMHNLREVLRVIAESNAKVDWTGASDSTQKPKDVDAGSTSNALLGGG
jgi:hypothetical protein